MDYVEQRSNTARKPGQSGLDNSISHYFVDDVAAHFGKVKAFGCKITEDIHETVYGELQYGVEDVGGIFGYSRSTSGTSIRLNGEQPWRRRSGRIEVRIGSFTTDAFATLPIR